MEWKPRYPQPFTSAQLRELDVPTITQEISRLDNSLQHLGRTQTELNRHLLEHPGDEEIATAMKENQNVIASQMERSFMLKMSLEERGINTLDSHYALNPTNGVTSAENPSVQETLIPENTNAGAEGGDQNEGVYL